MTVSPHAGSDAVLGAGALGLTVALRLVQRGRRVVVFEREPLPGGLAAGFEVEPGIWLEKFYHHLFRSDTNAIALISELGLAGDLVWHRPVTATLSGGRSWQLDSPGSLLRFRPLPPADRLRMGVVLGVLRTLSTARPLEGRLAAQWIRRTMGDAAYRTVWGPLLRGKFGVMAEEIALPWFWARVHDRSADLGYLSGGFQRLYDTLANKIKKGGGELRFGSTVDLVEPIEGGLEVRYTDQNGAALEDRFERVISTLPTRVTCHVVPALDAEYRARFEWGRALGAHCLVLSLDRPLTTGYWLNITDPDYPFMALVEHTNMRSPDEYGGRHLVYLGNYRPTDDPIFSTDAEQLLKDAAPYLAKLNPKFELSWVRDRWAFAAPFAQPVVTTDYREHIPPFETPLAGLYVANMYQVYPHDRGQNYSIRLAERLIGELP